MEEIGWIDVDIVARGVRKEGPWRQRVDKEIFGAAPHFSPLAARFSL